MSEPEPGVMHPVDQAFYDLAIKERDFERVKVDRLKREAALWHLERDEYRTEAERLKKVIERALEQLEKYDAKGPKQVARAIATLYEEMRA